MAVIKEQLATIRGKLDEKQKERRGLLEKVAADGRGLNAEELKQVDSLKTEIEGLGRLGEEMIKELQEEAGNGQGVTKSDVETSPRRRVPENVLLHFPKIEEAFSRSSMDRNTLMDLTDNGELYCFFNRLPLSPEAVAEQAIRAAQDRGIAVTSGNVHILHNTWNNVILEDAKVDNEMWGFINVQTTKDGNEERFHKDAGVNDFGERVPEAADSKSHNPVIDGDSIGVGKYSSKTVGASMELVQDSFFNWVLYLRNVMLRRMMNIVGQDLTTGADVSGLKLGKNDVYPVGLVQSAPVSMTVPYQTLESATGKISVPSTHTAGSLAAGFHKYIDYTYLNNFVYSIASAYRRGPRSGIMMNDQTWSLIFGMKDTTGRPLYRDDIHTGDTMRLFGIRVIINNRMPDMEPGEIPILIGDFSYFTARQVGSPWIIHEGYSVDNATARYCAYQRWGGKLVGAGNEIKAFKVDELPGSVDLSSSSSSSSSGSSGSSGGSN